MAKMMRKGAPAKQTKSTMKRDMRIDKAQTKAMKSKMKGC